MKVTIQKKTDQLNYEDFLGGVTRIVTVAGVKASKAESQYDIAIEGDARVWRPPATVLKILVEAWTDEASTWAGRRAELYGDPEVVMAGKKVGGIRVSRLSHIDAPLDLLLTTTRGVKGRFIVDPLPDAPTPPQLDAETERAIADLRTEWDDATPERRTAITAEVAALKGGA